MPSNYDLARDDVGFENAEPCCEFSGPMVPDDMAMIERAMLLDYRCQTCGENAGPSGLAHSRSALTTAIRKARQCLRCFSIRKAAKPC